MPNDVTARSSVMGGDGRSSVLGADGKPINESVRGSSSLGFGTNDT